jgi:16S rRNA (cytosine967-C5)-methyltransferase
VTDDGATWLGAFDDEAWARLLRREPVDERLLVRSVTAGRVLGIAVDLVERVLEKPGSAGGILRRGLREARALHSRERRLVADGLHALSRLHALIGAAVGPTSDPALALWLTWMVQLGADVPTAEATWRERTGTDLDLERTRDLRAAAGGGTLDEVIARVGSIPLAAVPAFRRALGDDLRAFLVASADRAPIGLRPVPPMDRERLLTRLAAAEVPATPTVLASEGVVVPVGTDLTRALAGADVDHLVQDEASQAVAEIATPRPGLRILDLCAGAGGKSLAMACRGAKVTASDIRVEALHELRRRAGRAGLPVRVVGPPFLGNEPPFDVVLVDAPCTGSGVWRRHPELRWRLADLAELTALQDTLLDQATAYVRPGGRLLFATCSMLHEEGIDRIDAFLARHGAYTKVGTTLATRPDRDGTDGFTLFELERTR